MSNKDLPPIQDLSKGNGAVIAPVVEGGDVVDENDKVVVGALVEDLGVRFVAASHCGVWCVVFNWGGLRKIE